MKKTRKLSNGPTMIAIRRVANLVIPGVPTDVRAANQMPTKIVEVS